MNLISCYSETNTSKAQRENILNSLSNSHFQLPIIRLLETLKPRLKQFAITIISPQIDRNKQLILPLDKIQFSLILDSNVPQYQYIFNVELNLHTNILKISATILKYGKMLNFYKEGIIQQLCTYSLMINGLMTNYSFRVHPLTGVAKLIYINHMTYNQVNQIFKFPVSFYQKIYSNLFKMAERLNERLLGKILHMSNQIPLKNILPQALQQLSTQNIVQEIKKIQSTHAFYPAGTVSYLWSINNRLKQIRRYIANSTIKYQFFSKDANRFFPQIAMRKKQTQKQLKIAKHNVKILPFSKEVRRMLNYYTPTYRLSQQQYSYGNVGDITWLEPTQQQLAQINQILKSQFVQRNGRVLSQIYVSQIESQIHLCSGGFAQISTIIVKASKKIDQKTMQMRGNNVMPIKPSKYYLTKKAAARQKLFWQKSIIQHFGRGACIFINNYYQVKVDSHAHGLTQKMFQDSIFMDYCSQKSLNYYIGRMGPILSINTKVFFLYQVSIGLRFLRDFGVVHLDMKPQNLLLRTAMGPNNKVTAILKIIDFGQAYCQTVIGGAGKINRGHTCPYAPPELVKNSQSRYTQKSDVFSLGVMILSIIFDINITDLKRLTSNYVFQTNERYNKLYSICLQKCKYIGYQPLMQCLLNLAYKCINPVAASRPYLNWICVILKCALIMLDQLQK